MAAIIQIDGWDPSAGGGSGAAVTIRLSSHDLESVCHLDGATWLPVIDRLPALRYDLFSGSFDGKVTTPGSSVRFSIEPWPALPGWWLADARVRIWTGQPGAAWIDWTLRFDGRATAQPEIEEGFASLNIAVDDRWLDTPVLATYAGTGGAEGPAALKGTPKPLALGAPRYASGVLVDPTNVVVQLSGYGAIEDVEVALDRLVRFGASAGDHASYAALVAATIPAGGWATAKAVGMVRHGAPPAGKLSYLVKGDKAGTDGWARLPGDIIRRIAILAGGTGKIDDISLDALNGSRPWNLSLMVSEQVTARELIQRIAASVNAVAGVSWTGKLFVAPIVVQTGAASLSLTGGGDPLLGDGEYLVTSADPGATGLTLKPDGSALPIVRSIRQLEASPPWWRLALGAEVTWEVHGPADIAFADLSAEDVKYADGTPIEDLKPAEAGATEGAPAGTPIGSTPAEDIESSVTAGLETDGTVKTDKVIQDSIAPQSTTIKASYANASGVTISGTSGFDVLASLSITSAAGEEIYLAYTSYAQNITDDYANSYYRIRKVVGATTTYIYGGSSGTGREVRVTDEGLTITITAKDVISAGATATYYVEAQGINSGSSSGSESVHHSDITFVAQEALN
jgi:hypothetical protein